jgi:Glyoxalase/Bleomycin resistance protein/Dioxygenase superfamily
MKSLSAYVEHANICVKNPENTIKFLLAAIPGWSIRGQGEMDWFGTTIQWFHVGDQSTYIAIQNGSSEKSPSWTELWTGVKHLGIVVPNMIDVVNNLKSAGFEVDHYGGEHPFRKNVYFLDNHGIQFEFIEYTSDKDSEKNLYV